MKVVVDTTVVENGFNSRSTEVQLLKTFLLRGKSELCVPQVVYEEALNRVRKRMMEVNSKIDALHRLTGGEDGASKIEIDRALRTYEESLKALLRDLNARLLPYPRVTHEISSNVLSFHPSRLSKAGGAIEMHSSGTRSSTSFRIATRRWFS